MRTPNMRIWLASLLSIAMLGCSDDGLTGPGGGGPGTGGAGGLDFEWTGSVAAGLAIEIKGISGSIAASPASDGRVEVVATKHAEHSDPSAVTIEVVEHAGGVTICAVYPDVPGLAPNGCAPGLAGNMSVRDNDVEVTFVVRVPTGVHFIGRTVAGSVTAEHLRGDAFGYTVAGKVELSTTGVAEGRTTSGSVDVTLGDPNPTRSLAFSTVTGSVTVRVPAATNATVRAATAAGSMLSDFPLTEDLPGSWRGTLGSGGPLISLTAVTGSVRLLSGS